MVADRTTKLAVTAAAAAVAVAAYYWWRHRSRSKSSADPVLRSAYEPSPYDIETVDLNFNLTEEEAVVTSVLKVAYRGSASPPPLYLDGEDLSLRSIAMNGRKLVEV
jgi:aminopeptidase N